jgi:hypothetical protein
VISPLEKINDVFDVFYLPDFDEQYAVRVSAGLGKSSASVGLENGWMMEHATMEIDNVELGKFIFRNIEKFIDIGAAAASRGAAPAASAAKQLTDKAKTQSLVPGEKPTVVLRVRYVANATPGLYPILKPKESGNPGSVSIEGNKPPTYVLIPFRPYTVLAFNVERQVLITLLNAAADRQPPPNGRDSSTSAKAKIEETLKKQADKITEPTRSKLDINNLQAVENIEGKDETTIFIPLKGGEKVDEPDLDLDKYHEWLQASLVIDLSKKVPRLEKFPATNPTAVKIVIPIAMTDLKGR